MRPWCQRLFLDLDKFRCEILSNMLIELLKDKYLFNPFMIFMKCDIRFSKKYSDFIEKFLCWENEVLQLVSEKVGPSGQVVESSRVV
jgi:hypothetical protein